MTTNRSTHKLDELMTVGSSGRAVVSCACGWTTTVASVVDARKAGRKALAAHKLAATTEENAS